ncbi:DNA-processing protein DprA [Candidatus Gottesmanbacteria bacterium]|nr:DNA-processing protein DprA [Candidatus Gottesmanbacteria bacterium]
MDIFKNCVAVVGSRRMTDYGRRVIEKLIPQLIFEKKTVVSGFMYGTDQYAHQTTINNGGKTIAVLGWGINKKLEDYDKKLAEEIIASGGLLISEWEEQEGALWTFPARNRIVAALSDEVFVIEAAEKSGSLITAGMAAKLKRQVWAVPGPITSKTSVGTNNLIAEGKAKMWLANATVNRQQTTDNSPILDILENESLTADELARKLNKSIVAIGTELSMLLLNGVILERSGKYYLTDVS